MLRNGTLGGTVETGGWMQKIAFFMTAVSGSESRLSGDLYGTGPVVGSFDSVDLETSC